MDIIKQLNQLIKEPTQPLYEGCPPDSWGSESDCPCRTIDGEGCRECWNLYLEENIDEGSRILLEAGLINEDGFEEFNEELREDYL